ncbi:aspartate aminotransferase family protein [Lentibacillus halophilus]|uniref:Aspartate aminotransferase family protein n=1 Tax=Lentibacillus halophilus TaxID=295065 RepID=A0ABP3J3F1_9BACI
MVMDEVKNQTSIEQLKEWDRNHFMHPTSSVRDHQENGAAYTFTKGEGIYLTDIDGREYVDGLSSLWNVNLGHGRSELAEAAKEQMETLPFSSSFNNYSNEPAIKLSRKIAELTPGNLNVTFFTSGGSESNESTFKIIREYWKLKGQPQRTKIVSLQKGYHGVTLAATRATGMDNFNSFGTSYAPGFLNAEPYLTGCEQGDKTHPNYENSIRGVIEREGADTIAAVIMEPIQGAGGLNVPPEGYLQSVRDLCDEFGIFMIADEIVCGFGRTGKMFGVENDGIIPDFMTVAKGITSGYIPLGAVIMKDSFRDELAELTGGVLFHGFTYSGHPTSCAVGLKTLEIIEKENIVPHVKKMETVVENEFSKLKEKHPHVTNERCAGLLGAFDVFKDPEENIPFKPEEAAAPTLSKLCGDLGLIVRPIMYKGANTIAFAPPLISSKSDIEEIFNIFSQALTRFERQVNS